jgi:hypothetical protein
MHGLLRFRNTMRHRKQHIALGIPGVSRRAPGCPAANTTGCEVSFPASSLGFPFAPPSFPLEYLLEILVDGARAHRSKAPGLTDRLSTHVLNNQRPGRGNPL